MAMADPGSAKYVHTGDRLPNDIGATVQSYLAVDDDPVVCGYAHLNKKQTLCKIRFRAESSFRKSHHNTGRLVNAAFPCTVTALPTGKSTHITPFYYVFLFRLTPF
jgi:hypothetical protein